MLAGKKDAGWDEGQHQRDGMLGGTQDGTGQVGCGVGGRMAPDKQDAGWDV